MVGCVGSKYPIIRKWQHGDGTHTYQTTEASEALWRQPSKFC